MRHTRNKRPAREQVASWSGRRTRQRNEIWPEPVYDQVRAISTCRGSSNLSATGRNQVCDQVCDLDSVMEFSQSRSQTSSRTSSPARSRHR